MGPLDGARHEYWAAVLALGIAAATWAQPGELERLEAATARAEARFLAAWAASVPAAA